MQTIPDPLVRALLPMDDCIELMASALADLAQGDAVQPLRNVIRLPGSDSALLSMPGYTGSPAALGVKIITVFPHNHEGGRPSHHAVVLLFSAEHGAPLALVDASALTALRTAAVSAVATRLLARPAASELALLGSGVQADSHLAAMRAVRPIRHVRVWSRTAAHAQAFARRMEELHDIPVEATSGREAVEPADIVCTCTAAREPVLHGAWLRPGVHVNAVGACTPRARELDTAAVRQARLFVDSREATRHEAGDFLLARSEGAVSDDHILGELGELLVGAVAGRQTDEEITLFESLGLAVEDVAAAHFVYRRASAGSSSG